MGMTTPPTTTPRTTTIMTGSRAVSKSFHRRVNFFFVEISDFWSMASIAPVCSPTAIICVTMPGKTLRNLQGLGERLAFLE